MDYLSIEELVNATSGDLTSKSEEVTSINELVIDSRIANKNSVFFGCRAISRLDLEAFP